jgi:hypothetical protein
MPKLPPKTRRLRPTKEGYPYDQPHLVCGAVPGSCSGRPDKKVRVIFSSLQLAPYPRVPPSAATIVPTSWQFQPVNACRYQVSVTLGDTSTHTPWPRLFGGQGELSCLEEHVFSPYSLRN